MIETILEEIRGLNLPLFWLTESEHGKRTTWSFVPDNPCNDIYSVTKVFTVTALGFLYDQGLWKPDDKICDLFRKKLPERYDPQWEEVTLDHVIRHRIGVTEDFLDIDNYDMTQFGSEDFLKLAFERPVPARPGVDYQYILSAVPRCDGAFRRKAGRLSAPAPADAAACKGGGFFKVSDGVSDWSDRHVCAHRGHGKAWRGLSKRWHI